MRYPEFLKAGDTIGFAAPSFGCSIEPYRSCFDRAQEVFRKKGFGILCGPNVYAGDGIGISTAPELCGREFTELYVSDACEAVLSCGGGELMCEILKYVDFEAIARAEPKWFMGYSDNTNLVFTLKERPLEPYACTEPRKIIVYDPARGILPDGQGAELAFSGRLIGGCLDSLATLCGTPYDRASAFAERYREDGIVWFLEACDLTVFGIRRALWQLKNAGWFRHVSGFLIGRPLAAQEDLLGLDHIHAVTDELAEFGVPILMDADIGHLPPMIPLISGSCAQIRYNPEADDFRLKMLPK